jgi:hypothetical protein
MIFETGLAESEIDRMLDNFEVAGKAHHDNGVIFVANLRKYHETKSPKVQTRILKDVAAVKECELKRIYLERYGMDTLSGDENGVGIPPSTSSLVIYKEVTGREPGKLYEDIIIEKMGPEPNRAAFARAWKLWLSKGYSPRNYAGIFEWYEFIKREPNWKPQQRRNFNGPAGESDTIWTAIKEQMQKRGTRYGPGDLPDEAMKAIRLAGGWQKLCQSNLKEAERAFMANYREVTYG